MEFFSYECDQCDGGKSRSANPSCKPECQGGQICWEYIVALILKAKPEENLLLKETMMDTAA